MDWTRIRHHRLSRLDKDKNATEQADWTVTRIKISQNKLIGQGENAKDPMKSKHSIHSSQIKWIGRVG